MTTAKLNLAGPGAVYHRVSTDNQDTERQRATTREWLARNGVTVKPDHVFEDVGWSRADARRRPAFQQMLAMVDAGRIKWIVVDRQDRFGTSTKFELFAYLHQLVEAGCLLYTTDDAELTSHETADGLMTYLSADQSDRELREKSMRNLEGKRQLARRGRWLGGTIPYGMDVVAFREAAGSELVEQWRVQAVRRDLKVKISPDGGRREYEGAKNFPASELDEILQLRPTTDPAVLNVVRAIFTKYAGEDTTPAAIAKHLERQGVAPPPYSDHWRPSHVQYLLGNPVYCGRIVWNRHTSGTYFKFAGGRRVEKRPGEKPAKHAPEDWVEADEQLFAPVVDPKLFERVQAKIASRDQRPRACRSPGYVFSGLVTCGNCGGPMTGSRMPMKGVPLDKRPYTYLCGTYNNWKGDRATCPCKAFRVHQNFLVNEVQRWLDETGQDLILSEETAALAEHFKPGAYESALRRILPALRRMFERVRPSPQMLYNPDDQVDGVVTALLSPGERSEGVERNDELERAYRGLFNAERDQAQHRLDQLETEHTKLTLAWESLPTARSKAKATTRLKELEEEIDELEARVTNWADEMRAAMEEYHATAEAWENARNLLENQTTAREVAGAIKGVLGRVTITFRETGRSWPVGEVASVKFAPTQGFLKDGSTTRSA